MKKIVYILVASVFLGAHILAIDIGVAQLSIYRITLVITLGLCTLLLFQNNPVLEGTFYREKIQYRAIYLFWLVVAIVSVLWASSLIGWVKGLFFVGCGIFSILFITTFTQTEKDVKTLFIIVFSMIVMHQLIGFYEIVTNHYIWANLSSGQLSQFASNWSARLPYSTFSNVNDYSTLIFASVPFACIFFHSKKYWLKGISILSILATIFFLIRTGSRGNQLALMVFVVSLIGLKFLNRKILKYGAMILSFIILIGIVGYFASSTVRFNVYDTIQEFISRGGSNFYRINMILNGFIYLIRHFGLGVGAGNVEYWLGNHPIYEVDAPNIHNWFMDILTGYGLIVFILYSVMYIYILRQLYVSYKYSNNSFIRTSSMFLFAYVISFVISSMSSATNMIIEWQWVYWGVMIAYVQSVDGK